VYEQRMLQATVSPYTLLPQPAVYSQNKLNVIQELFDTTDDRFGASLQTENSSAHINKDWFDRYYSLQKYDQYHGTLLWRYVLIENNTRGAQMMRIQMVQHG
jgi:hypothetical protein